MSGLIFQAATELSVGETDGQITVTFLRSGDLSQPVTVTYDVTDESTTQGVDYVGSSGTAHFAAGQDRATASFDIVNDALGEATETFVVSIADVSSGEISIPRTLRINILDDENPVLPPVEPPLVSDYEVITEYLLTGLDQPINFEFAPFNSDLVYVAQKSGLIHVFNHQTGEDLGVFIDLRAQVNESDDRGLIDFVLHPDFENQPYVYAFYVVDPPGTGSEGAPALDSNGNRFAHVVRYTADVDAGYLRVVPDSGVVIAGGTGTSLADINGGGKLNFRTPTLASAASSERFINPDADPDPLVIDGFKQNYIKVDSNTHAGGALAFGPDGMLYISTGDGTSATYADPRTPHVQNLNSMSGKILRVDPITGQGLTDNPFYEGGQSLDSNISKVYQYGLRNPFSMTFDSLGRLFITDTGWNAYEEINSAAPGANFGWPWFEGREGGVLAQTSGYNTFAAAAAFYEGVADGTIVVTPAYAAFGHAESAPGFQNQAITGGTVVYSGNRYPAEFQNDFFFTNFPFRTVFTIDTNNRQDIKYLYESNAEFAPVHFVQGPDGYVYFTELGGFDPSSPPTGTFGRLQIFPLNGSSVTVSPTPVVTEGSDPTVNITFTVSEVQSMDLTLTYSTVDATALAGSDFAGATSATVVIPAGQTSVTVPIAILNNGTFELLETFSVVLESAILESGQSILATSSSNVIILDNDPVPAGVNLVFNGSFELPSVAVDEAASFTSVPGWTAIPGGTIEIWNDNNGVVATNGVNFVELDWLSAHDGFYQDVQTVAGQAYTLSFDARSRPGSTSATTSIEVLWNDVLIATVPPGSAWITYSFTVTGAGGAERLTFRELLSQSADGRGAMFDNVRLIATGTSSQQPVAGNDTASTDEDVAVAVAVLANDSDPDGAPLTITHIAGQAVAVGGTVDVGSALVTRNANGTLGVAPDANFNGDIAFTYRVSDGVLSDDASVTVAVASVADAPVVAAPIVDQNAITNQPFSFTVPANAFTDADGDALSYTARLVGGGALPAWLTFNPATRTFSGTPTTLGDIAVEVIASDGTLSASDAFTLSVAATPPANLLVNGSFELPLVEVDEAAGFATVPGWTAIPGGMIEIWNANNGVVATEGVNFVELDWLSARDGFYQDVQTVAGQAYTLSFDARSRPGSTSATTSIEVLWNDVLIATVPPGSAWTTYSFNVSGTGGPNRLTFRELLSQSADGRGAMFDNVRLAAAGAPTQPPVAVDDNTVSTDEDVAVAVAVLANDSDPDGAPLTITHIAGQAVAVGGTVDVGSALVTRNANGTLGVAPDANFNGDITFTYRVSDGVLTDDASVTVAVASVADAPVVAALIADQNAITDQPFSFTVPANAFTDADGDTLTYTARLVGGGALPDWLTFNPTTRTFSGTPTTTDDLSIEVIASDGTLSASDAFTLNVAATPPAAVNLLVNGSFESPLVGANQFAGLTTIPGWTAIPGGTIELWNAHRGVVATDGANFVELDWGSAHDGFYQDVQTVAGQAYTLQFDARSRPGYTSATTSIEVLWNDVLIATVPPGSAWTTYSFNVSGTGGPNRLTFREPFSQSADGHGAMFDNVRLIAAGAANQPPVAGDDNTASTDEDIPVVVAVLANDSDPEGTPLAITHIAGQAVAVGGTVDVGSALVTRNANGTLGVAPDANFNGDITFTYRVSDGALTDDASVTVAVASVADAPVVAALISDQNAIANQPFSFTVPANAFTDADGDTLTYTARLVGGGALPAWLTFNPTTRTFSGTPTTTDDLSIEVTASDGTLSASDAFVLAVAATPPAGALNLVSSSPADNATDAATTTDIVLTFDQVVQAGGGNITLTDWFGNVLTVTVGGADPDATLTFSGNQVTIDLAADLITSNHYSLVIDTGAIVNAASNAFDADGDVLEFTTPASPGASLVGTSARDVLIGTAGNDDLRANVGSSPDYLSGGLGNDVLRGSGGNDVLVGGAGNDSCGGAGGADQFRFNAGEIGIFDVDKITDLKFAQGDTVYFDDFATEFFADTHNAGNAVQTTGHGSGVVIDSIADIVDLAHSSGSHVAAFRKGTTDVLVLTVTFDDISGHHVENIHISNMWQAYVDAGGLL